MTPSLCLHTCSSHIYALKRTHPRTLLVRGGPTLQRRRVPNHIHSCHAHPRASSKEPPLLSANYYTQSTLDRKLQSANFPIDQDGRTYHVGTCLGEVSNRILGVGSIGRARLLGSLLSPLPGHEEAVCVESSRGFLTITGQWNRHAVSIVTHLMGFGNLDLALRETRAVTTGPLYIIRIGTCGSLNGKVGQVHVPSRGSVAILRDPDAFLPGSDRDPYRITEPLLPDGPLTAALLRVHEGLNASADSFFSSQGRPDPNFDDRNSNVIDQLLAMHPHASSLEMETFHLLHLSSCSRGSVRATAGALALADRLSDTWIDVKQVNALELLAGRAALSALVSTCTSSLQEMDTMGSRSIWAD